MSFYRRFKVALLFVSLFLAAFVFTAQAQIPEWQAGVSYSVGNQVTYSGAVYQCLQPHTALVGWEPATTPALWQPTGSSSATSTATSVPATATTAPPTTATDIPPTATNVPATATVPSSGSCTAPVWSNTATYNNGDVVSYNGHQWQAKWWTQNEAPGSTGEWGVWQDLGACDTSNPTPTSTSVNPTATNTVVVPTATDTVVNPTATNTVVPPTATSTAVNPTATNTVVAPTATHTPIPNQSGKQIVGYFAQWGIYGRGYYVKHIDTSGSAAKLTTINYAFANIVNGKCIMTTQTGVMDAFADYQKSFGAADSVDGVADKWDQPIRGNFNQLKKLKAKYPHLKVLISIGGWTWSKGFSDAALTEASRQQVVSSCIDLYIKGNLPVADGAGGPGSAAGIFDGIDIDWEYPAAAGDNNIYRPEDTHNFTLLLAEFRRQLNAINPNLMLTIAPGAGVDKFTKIELSQIHPYLNYINLMTYDFHGAWETKTNFNAPIYTSASDPSAYPANTYSIDYAVQAYKQAGVPANKLILGVPFYGRGWTGVTNQSNGLYQNATGAARGTYENGFEDYKVLKTLSYPQFYDSVTHSAWMFDGTTFWSYDPPAVLTDKMNYVKSQNLAGAMIWSLDGDDTTGTAMSAVYNGLK